MTLFPRKKEAKIGQVWSCGELYKRLGAKSYNESFDLGKTGKMTNELVSGMLNVTFQVSVCVHAHYLLSLFVLTSELHEKECSLHICVSRRS